MSGGTARGTMAGGSRLGALLALAAVGAAVAAWPASARECGVWLPVQGASANMLAVVWGGGKFVAVGTTGAHTSVDGSAWSNWPMAVSSGSSPTRVAWNGTTYVAVGNRGAIFTSPDGQVWTKRSAPTSRSLAGLAWGNGTWVAVGDLETVIISPDGVTWTEARASASGFLTSVTWTGSAFVAVGQGGVALRSGDGTDWTPGAVAGEDWLTDVLWTGEQLVATAFDGTVLTSPTGTSWTARAETGVALRRVCRAGSHYLAAGDGNTLLASPDLVAWALEIVDGDPPDGNLTGLAWNGTVGLAVGRPSGALRSHCGAWADFTFAPASPAIGEAVAFSVSDSQGLGWVRWDFSETGCGGAPAQRELGCVSFPCTFATSFAFASAGVKTVRLWGASGETGPGGELIFALVRTREVTVGAGGACAGCLAPSAPTAPSPPHQAAVAGGAVALAWAAPASGTPPISYDVDLDGGTVCQGVATPQCLVEGVAESAQQHVWMVTARNACGTASSPAWSFLACGAAAVPTAAFDWAPAGPLPTWPDQQQPFAGQEVAFADRSSGAPSEWAWSGLADAGLVAEPAPRRAWWAAGAHAIGLRAGNCRGWSAETGKVLTVHPDLRPRRWAFDFGTDTSAVAPGFVAVRQGSAYAAALGYGWVAGTVIARERGSGDDLTRDFHFSPDATFAVDVPERTYDVTVWLGDTTRAHDRMAVAVEGLPPELVSTAAGAVERRVFRVRVSDGQLTLHLRDRGGLDPNTVVNGLEVVAADPLREDFGTPASPVAAGFVGADEGRRWAAPRWCGWAAGRVSSRDRATGGDLLRDLCVTQDATFACALGRGVWDVALTLGDATAAHDQIGTFLEGSLAGTVSTAARKFTTSRHRIVVADGELTVRLADLGGADANAVVNALEAARVGPFDFGPAAAPVAAGHTAVSQASRYAPASGFGWVEGSVGTRDRGVGGELLRDLATTAAATFAVDVPDGSYDVTLLMGDAASAHDAMSVQLEGEEVALVTTPRGATHVGTYRCSVADGQLTVRLVDAGGSDANVVINGLALAPAPAAAVAAEP